MIKIYDFETKFIEKQTVVLNICKYHNGRVCMQIQSLCGGSLATATVNLPNFDVEAIEKEIGSPCAFIKDYSENEGMVKALTKAGIIEPLDIQVQSGFVILDLFKLNLN